MQQQQQTAGRHHATKKLHPQLRRQRQLLRHRLLHHRRQQPLAALSTPSLSAFATAAEAADRIGQTGVTLQIRQFSQQRPAHPHQRLEPR